MDPTTPTNPPAAPAATPPTTPPAAATPPAAEKPKSSLLSNILGLVKPEEVDVKPKADPETPPAAKPAETTPAATTTPAAKPAETTPAATPTPETKKVPVKRKEAAPAPAAPTAEEVRRIAAEEAAKVKPAAPAPAAPAAPDDSDLSAEEKDELELAKLAEAKDPARKGLADKFRKFYAEQKKFLEGRAATDPDYDPSQDPEYKRFLAKSEPKLAATERKQLREEKIAAEAAARATKAAEERLTPEIQRLRQKTLEIEHRPKINQRVESYVGEVASGMPEEIVKFYNENGRSVEKTREAFPDEFDIVVQSVNGARALAEEALMLRRGLKSFDPQNSAHSFLDSFVDRQAKAVLADPNPETRTRDGKTFVHPYEFDEKNADKHWTFDDEDILESLKSESQKEAKARIDNHRKRINAAIEAAKRRSTAPSGTSTTATPPAAPAPSTRTPPAPVPGVATPAATKPKSVLSGLLNLG